jgi:SAM-dependent methyltransferase
MSTTNPYTIEYFQAQGYARTMLESRMVNGRFAKPLAVAAMDMVEEARPLLRTDAPSLFDVGCAHGYIVCEALERGWDARGMDLSPDVIAAGPVPKYLRAGDATRAPIDDCDVAVCLNVFEHLTPEQALDLGRNLSAHAGLAVTVINKSDHDATHVTLRPNRWWVNHLAAAGLSIDWFTTFACRAAYLRSGNWHERWWTDCLVFRSRSRGHRRAPLGRALIYLPALARTVPTLARTAGHVAWRKATSRYARVFS